MSERFIHLNVHTEYSMLEGAGSVEEVVSAAARAGMGAVSVTDTDGMYGAVPFSRACARHGVRGIYGAEVTSAPVRRTRCAAAPAEVTSAPVRRTRCAAAPAEVPSAQAAPSPPCRPSNPADAVPSPPCRRAVTLARTQAGFEAICALISRRHLEDDFDWEAQMAALPPDVVILSSDIPLLTRCASRPVRRGATFVEIQPRLDAGGRRERNRLIEAALRLGLRAAATNGVRFARPDQYDVHRLLSAMRTNTTVGSIPPGELAPPHAYLATAEEMAGWLPNAPAALAETVRIAGECRVDLDLDTRKLPRFPVPGGGDPYLYLRGIALRGLSERFTGDSGAAREVLDRELAVIQRMGLADYFLICWDIIRHARSRHIPCLGRGSAANSIVSYCLYITHVDPLAHNMFFERFLNEERSSLPDFDLDFGTEDRERVLDYIFGTYGDDRVAMIGTHVTFQVRGAFRETAVALGYPKGEVDGVIKRLPHYSSTDNLEAKLATSVETRDLPLDQEPFVTIHRYAQRIGGFPRHMATHPCGLVITPAPIHRYMPMQRGDKGLPITQWSMYPVEDAGLLKIDILGQKGLEVISNTIRAVRAAGEPVPDNPRTILTDPQSREWMRSGRTIGCFYIESPAMINLIRQARCDDFECLTALSSIIRPGVSNYGGKHTYLRRHLKLEPERVLHPLLQPILRDTRGCLIYQEQVIRIASELAGLTLGEADDLRRLMSFKKNRRKLSDYRDRFYEGCRKRGLPEDITDEIYRQVESFAGYAFCKAHSASFAMESFESMYYKSHYPAEFMAAVLSGGGGYYGSLEYLEESRRLGLMTHSPCINGSEYRFTGRGEHLRVGLMQVKSLQTATAERIVSERARNGPYTGLLEFVRRVAPSVDEARNLARCGAMRSLGRTIPELLWGIELLFSAEVAEPRNNAHIQYLWDQVPAIPDPPLPQRLRWELEILGLTPSAHPLAVFPAEVAKARRLRPVVRSVDIDARAGRDTYLIGWRVIGKKTRTKKSQEIMSFVTFSDEWGRFEATFFPASFERNARELIRGRGPFLLKGKVDVEFGVPMLCAERVQLLAADQPEIRSTYGPVRPVRHARRIKPPASDGQPAPGVPADRV